MKIKRHIGLSAIILLVITAIVGCTSGGGNTLSETEESTDSSKVEPVITKYGLPIEGVRIIDTHGHCGPYSDFYIPRGGEPGEIVMVLDSLGIDCQVCASVGD